MTEGSLLYQIV